ncbi:MAG TPA: TolC family protein [Bryobacteraceae bacterium]|nr:TolC family protein [Bryobacteraceae bacterium]
MRFPLNKISIGVTLVFAAAFAPAQAPQPSAPQRLTLQQAEQIAIKNHPQIQAAQNEVNYAAQQVVINRAPYYPLVTGEVTGTQANDNARIGAGELQASHLFSRFGQGAVLDQLITDSGRTPNLIASARLQGQAAEQNLNATQYDVVLAVNHAYFGVLRAQAVVRVANETVVARQQVADQINELAKNKLKSDLDVAYAEVQVSQAKLLLLSAQQDVATAQAELGRALGSDQPATYQLAEEQLPSGPPAKVDDLVAQAMQQRPELASLRLNEQSAQKFYFAERDLKRPTVSVMAVAGAIPFINSSVGSPTPLGYEGIGANVSIPVFNGHLFSAREEAARQRSLEAEQRLRNEEESISRDVRVSYSGVVTAYQSIDVTAQYLREAALALDLANGRYNLGLSSIVELTQAQLYLTQAEIANVNAKYDYENQYAGLQYTIGALR